MYRALALEQGHIAQICAELVFSIRCAKFNIMRVQMRASGDVRHGIANSLSVFQNARPHGDIT